MRPNFSRSANALASCVMSRSVNVMLCVRRNSFVRLQNIQPGWENSTTALAIRPHLSAPHGAGELLLNCSRGRNSAPIDSSTRHVVRWLGDWHPEDVLPLPKQRWRRIACAHVANGELPDVDVLVVLGPAKRFQRIIQIVDHVRGV